MSELPRGWVEVEWDKVTTKDGFRRGPFGGNLKKSCFVESGFAIYEQYAPINNDCTNFRYFVDEEKYEELQSFKVDNGDFLISCSGTMGKITKVPDGAPKGLINQALLRIRLIESCIDSEYFLKLFRSPILQNQVLNSSVGGAIQNLAAVKELKKILIPLAPLAEQKRIVEKLDQVLAQVDTIKARLDSIPAILKRFRQSVLAAAVRGKLTEEWRGNDYYNSNGYPKSWKLMGLADVGVLARGKSKHRPRNDIRLFGSEYPFIQTGEVANSNGEINSATKFYSEFGLAQSRLFPSGTLCITIAANIADTAILNISACFPDSVVGFTPELSKCNVFFVKYLIDVNKGNLEAFAPATAQKNINLKVLNAMRLPFPELEEQVEIVLSVEKLFTFANTIEAQVQKAQQRVDKLTQSILAKAFRGELVPQDPNDEPADELLKRIATARTEAEALAKAAKKAGKKTTGRAAKTLQ